MAIYTVQSLTGPDHIQKAYVGKDNPIEVLLQADGEDYDYSTAKEVHVKIGNVELDTTADTKAFDLTESTLGRLRIFIGEELTIPPQTHKVKIEVKDASDRVLYFGEVRVKIEAPGI